MLFYRVENEDKQGPYNNCPIRLTEFLEKKGIIDYSDHDNSFSKYMMVHPLPQDDCLLRDFWISLDWKIKENYIFGFESLDKVFNWFCLSEELQYLKDSHFRISIYETQDYHHGKWQSVANKESLILIDTLEF